MYLSVLISYDIWLAWSLTKFKRTITKQKGSRKDAKRRLCSAFAHPPSPQPQISFRPPSSPFQPCQQTHLLCCEYGALEHQTSSLLRISQSISIAPLWASPFTLIAACLDLKLDDDPPTEPPLSNILPLFNPSHIAMWQKWLKIENVRKISLGKSERCGGAASTQFVSTELYFSTLGKYKINEYAYLC